MTGPPPSLRLASALLLLWIAHAPAWGASAPRLARQAVDIVTDGARATVRSTFTLTVDSDATVMPVSLLLIDGARVVDAWVEGDDEGGGDRGRRAVRFAAARGPRAQAAVPVGDDVDSATRTVTLTVVLDNVTEGDGEDTAAVLTVPVPVAAWPLVPTGGEHGAGGDGIGEHGSGQYGAGDRFAVVLRPAGGSLPPGPIVRPFPSHLRRRGDGTIGATLPVPPAFVRAGFDPRGGPITAERAADGLAVALLVGLGALGARRLLRGRAQRAPR